MDWTNAVIIINERVGQYKIIPQPIPKIEHLDPNTAIRLIDLGTPIKRFHSQIRPQHHTSYLCRYQYVGQPSPFKNRPANNSFPILPFHALTP